MKLQKYIALPLAAVLCMSLAACGASSSMASSAASSAVSSAPASSAAGSAAGTPEGNFLTPREVFAVPQDGSLLTATTQDGNISVVATLNNGTYAASIENGATITAAHDANTAVLQAYTLQLYTYDLYDATAVESLKVGDTISTHTGNGEETRDVVVESIETEDGFVTINGGVEEGGMYLFCEGDAYRTLTTDDFPVFYPVGGNVVLALAEDVTLSDSSAEYEAEPTVTTGDAAVAEVINADEVGFTCYNTSVTVENGVITEITRVWVP